MREQTIFVALKFVLYATPHSFCSENASIAGFVCIAQTFFESDKLQFSPANNPEEKIDSWQKLVKNELQQTNTKQMVLICFVIKVDVL